jgi:hypothetical protein
LDPSNLKVISWPILGGMNGTAEMEAIDREKKIAAEKKSVEEIEKKNKKNLCE